MGSNVRFVPHKRLVCRAAAAAALLTAGAAFAQQSANADLVDTNGQQIGNATLEQTPAGVLIRIDAEGLPPGEHAFHIHEKGICDSKDGFKSAGAHFTPTKQPHGYLSKGGPHAGDMPNQFVAGDGKLRAEVLNTKVRLDGKSLLRASGTALVIHAGRDDYKSQPAGDAGDRIACAVIKKGG
jgi:Cu-Zn family superoxide dismutase